MLRDVWILILTTKMYLFVSDRRGSVVTVKEQHNLNLSFHSCLGWIQAADNSFRSILAAVFWTLCLASCLQKDNPYLAESERLTQSAACLCHSQRPTTTRVGWRWSWSCGHRAPQCTPWPKTWRFPHRWRAVNIPPVHTNTWIQSVSTELIHVYDEESKESKTCW